MRAVILLFTVLALAGCSGTSVNGRASSHGPDRVTLGFPL
jgi:hypothetical protein